MLGLADKAMQRRLFDIHGGNRDWFDLFQKAQASAPVGAFRMSELSRLLQDVDVVYIGSIANETYCYTVDESFRAGAPVIAAAMGASVATFSTASGRSTSMKRWPLSSSVP